MSRSRSASAAHAAVSPSDRADDLETIYRAHAGMVWRALRRMGVPEDVAPDLVHDVFVVVHRRLDQFDERRSLRAWLYGIARGVAANWRRGVGRNQRRLRVVSQQPNATPSGPGAQVDEANARLVVEALLQRLDPQKREAFVLIEIEGMTGPEVADALGLKVDTVYSRLRKARRMLADMVERQRRGEEQR